MPNEIKILVCGDRNWTDKECISRTLEEFISWLTSLDFKDVRKEFLKTGNHESALQLTVINGACKGADKLSTKAFNELKSLPNKVQFSEIKEYPADWEKYGRAAGPIRNRQMLVENPQVVLAFHQNIKESRGTKDMLKCATRHDSVKLIVLTTSSTNTQIYRRSNDGNARLIKSFDDLTALIS